MKNDAPQILKDHWNSLAILDGTTEIKKFDNLTPTVDGNKLSMQVALYGTDTEVTLPQNIDGVRLYNGDTMLREEAIEPFELREEEDDMTVTFEVIAND